MKSYKIKLETRADVENFVRITGSFRFDIDVFYNHYTVDGKSILGILGLDLSHPLTVQCTEEDPAFELAIQKYRI